MTAFDLSPRHLALRAEARRLAAAAAGYAAVAGESETVDPDMRRLLAASGLTGVVVPGAYGGRDEQVDPLAVTVVREALAAQSGHLDSLFAMQGIGSHALAVAGHEDVRRAWLPRIAMLAAIAALALTEPQAGSDLRALATTVTQSGETLRVSGHKSFITNAGDADSYAVLAREGDGLSLVLVPAATDGVSIRKCHQIIAPHVLGDVLFDDAQVPATHRIGAPGAGFKLVLQTLACFRVSVAGAALGLAQAALDEAVRHTTGRVQFGQPLADLGGVQSMLARSWTDLEMARALTYRAAAAAAADPLGSLDLSSMAKVGATEAAGRIVDRSVQLMGRFGLVRGAKIERLYREARPMRIYEGSTEVILSSLAKRLVQKGTA